MIFTFIMILMLGTCLILKMLNRNFHKINENWWGEYCIEESRVFLLYIVFIIVLGTYFGMYMTEPIQELYRWILLVFWEVGFVICSLLIWDCIE